MKLCCTTDQPQRTSGAAEIQNTSSRKECDGQPASITDKTRQKYPCSSRSGQSTPLLPFCRTPAEQRTPGPCCRTGAGAEQRRSTSRQAARRGAGTNGARTGSCNRQQGMRPRRAATTASTTGGRENSRGSVWPNGSATAGGRGWLSAGPAALRQAEDSRAPRRAANRQIRDGGQEAATGGRWEQRTVAGEEKKIPYRTRSDSML